MGSCVPLFSLRHPRPTCLPWASSALFLTLYSYGLLLVSLGFPDLVSSYSSLGFMGLPSIPYSLCLHCFGSAAAHSYFFFHMIHCPWVCYLLFLSFRALLSPFAFSMPIYLFHGPMIQYSCCLDLMVFVLYLLPTSFQSVLLGWASSLLFGFHKKTLSNTMCNLNPTYYIFRWKKLKYSTLGAVF